MSYPIDHPLLRLTGERLAAGSGTFGEREIRRLFDGALEDDTLYRAGTAALLIRGYHRRTGTRTRHDGSTEYDEAQTPCSCAGGWTPCGQCGGSGRV
jgi:hypothetical protein